MTRHHMSRKLGLSNSFENLPNVCTGLSYQNDYGSLQGEKTISSFSGNNLNPMPSRYSNTLSPWRPVTYFSASRIQSPYFEGAVVNRSRESGDSYELEGLKVPAVYSAARNALYQPYTRMDWIQAHNRRLTVSDEACRRAERAVYDATNLGLDASDRVQRTQQEVSEKLGKSNSRALCYTVGLLVL